MMKNILKEAHEIIHEKSQEDERRYGPIDECMKRTADMAGIMLGKKFSVEDIYAVMVAMKFARQSYAYKRDNLLDAVAYIGAWQEFIQKTKKDNELRI